MKDQMSFFSHEGADYKKRREQVTPLRIVAISLIADRLLSSRACFHLGLTN
jgi:hypothetical protein